MGHRLHLNVTDCCNLRCTHCYWPAYGVNGDPSLDRLDAILRQFKAFAVGQGDEGNNILTLGGGEPTLRDDLEDIIRLAVKRGFDVRLVTNAVNVDRARAHALADAGLRFVQVSLDGSCRETHERVRGHGTWARTMRGIEAFKDTGVPQVLSYVLLPGLNLAEAPALLDLANDLGLAGVKFARPIEAGQAPKNGLGREVEDGQFWETFLRIVAYGEAIDFQRLLLFFDPLAHLLPVTRPTIASIGGLGTDLCQCDRTELVEIDAGSGNITYCRVRAVLGNIWRDDLTELWRRHPVLVGIRGKSAAGECDGCSVVSKCRGGCPAVVEARTGDVLGADGDCPTIGAFSAMAAPIAADGLLPVARLRRGARSGPMANVGSVTP